MKKHTGTIEGLSWRGDVQIPAGHSLLEGILEIPDNPRGLVVFAHGSGSSRHSARNRFVAEGLHRESLATLLFDLLTLEEEHLDARMRHLRFDIDFLSHRLRAAALWTARHEQTAGLSTGYFGSSTGAAAALVLAGEHEGVGAIVSRGGRPDLAADALTLVDAPTLLIVGGTDDEVLALNEHALARLRCTKRLEIVPGAGHLFEEPGALDQVVTLAAGWFATYLTTKEWKP